ncbi:MAG TPA: type II secretion system protein [Acidothermaceae bacterium]|jgi:prepilin-type N-terminal cleavage/methylation domain-containing protein
MTWFSRRLRAARMQSDPTGGFSLIEVIVALSLILFVMTSSVVFFIRSMQTSSTQQVREAAISLADQATEQARSVPSITLLSGRDKGRSDTQWAALPAAAATAKAVSQEVWDSTATGSSTPVVPFSTADTTTLVNKTQYTVNVAIGECWISTTTAVVCNVPSPIGTATPLYRVIVDVHWTAKIGESCPTAGCDYVVTTLRDPSTDPLFNSNGG